MITRAYIYYGGRTTTVAEDSYSAEYNTITEGIYKRLRANASLATLLTTYEGQPAVFCDVAPEEATRPYVTFTLTREYNITGPLVDQFTLDVDYWEYGDSRVSAREVVEAVEYEFDMSTMEAVDYANVRFFTPESLPVGEDDPRQIHYNTRFVVRASRGKFIRQLT